MEIIMHEPVIRILFVTSLDIAQMFAMLRVFWYLSRYHYPDQNWAIYPPIVGVSLKISDSSFRVCSITISNHNANRHNHLQSRGVSIAEEQHSAPIHQRMPAYVANMVSNVNVPSIKKKNMTHAK